jgi:hypothetical protein
MEYQVNKLIHLTAILALFLAFGAVIATDKSVRMRWQSLLHGIALFVILVAGLTMLHGLGIHDALPLWVKGKLVIWLLFGLALTPAKRKLLPKSLLVFILLLLGAGAGFLALWKPGQ